MSQKTSSPLVAHVDETDWTTKCNVHACYRVSCDKTNGRGEQSNNIKTRTSSSNAGSKLSKGKGWRKKTNEKSNIDLYELKLKEIELLKKKLSKLEKNVLNFETKTTSNSSLHSTSKSCFNFFRNICSSKKNLPRPSSKNSFNTFESCSMEAVLNSSMDEVNPRGGLPVRKSSKGRDSATSSCTRRQHKITNNNTIVLPEGYGSQTGEQVIGNLTLKLETQGAQIDELKQCMKQCLNLLKEKNIEPKRNFNPSLLDEYLHLTRSTPTKNLDSFFNNNYNDMMRFPLIDKKNSALPFVSRNVVEPSIEQMRQSLCSYEKRNAETVLVKSNDSTGEQKENKDEVREEQAPISEIYVMKEKSGFPKQSKSDRKRHSSSRAHRHRRRKRALSKPPKGSTCDTYNTFTTETYPTSQESTCRQTCFHKLLKYFFCGGY